MLVHLRYLVFCIGLLCLPITGYAQTDGKPSAQVLQAVLTMLLMDDDEAAPPAPTGTGELLGHWALDDGSGLLAADSSSYEQDGDVRCQEVETCSPTWTGGKYAGALRFNATTDYLALPHETLLGEGDVTLSLWFRTAVTDRTQTLLSGAEQFNTNASRIALLTDNRIQYYTGDRSWERETWYVAPFNDNVWHQLVIVRDDTNNEVTLYLDGVSYGTMYPSMDLIDVEQEALIAGLEQDSVGGRFDLNESFAGDMDDIRVIGRVLPRHEVELAYENREWQRFSVQVDRGSDDAETTSTSSTDPNLGDWDIDFHQYESGLRFNQVGIPPEATVEKAYVEFRSSGSASTVITVPIHGELTPNAETFSNATPIAGRTRTAASSSWTPEASAWYRVHRSADLSAIVQEIIDQPGWAMGNSLAILFEPGPTADRRSALSYDYLPEHAARLVVYFSGGEPDASPPSAPANLVATAGSTSIELGWDHAIDTDSAISHYQLYRRKNGGEQQLVSSIPESNLALSFTDTNLQAGANYSYTVTAVNHAELESAASSPAAATALGAAAAYAHWPLNESSGATANDVGPGAQHGQLGDPAISETWPAWVGSGQSGGSLSFDGVDDYLDLPYGVLNGASSVTVSMWIKTAAAPAYQTLISGANHIHHDAFRLALRDDNRFQYMHSSDIVEWEIDPLNDDQWHHVLLIANDATNGVLLYIDGVFQGGESMTLDPIQLDPGGLIVGQDQDSVGGGFAPDQTFIGQIDEIRIEPRVLNWTEIQNQVLMDSTPPDAPTGLSATQGAGALVELNWAAATDAETGICKYLVYRGTTPGSETFLFEVGNVTHTTDVTTADNTDYRYRVAAENCVAMEGPLSGVATLTSGSDAGNGLQTVSGANWDETAVRRVLRVFAYGGHASDAQISTWAGMSPAAAINQILTFDKTNPLLSPAEDASVDHAVGLYALQQFWGSNDPDNPMRWDKRDDYHPLYFNSSGSASVSYSNLERAWTQAIATRGLNPFLHKMAFFLSNYQMSISEFKTRSALIRDYYDTLLHALSTGASFIDVINEGAKHATVAKAYGHASNRYYNDVMEFYGNDDFAREYFQLFFAIQGEREDEAYHEDVTIENNAMLLTGMELDRAYNAFGSDSSSDWDIAPIGFSDHIDATGDYVYNQSNHHGNCLEILHEVICGATASEKLEVLSPIAANHVESLANLPLFIVNLFADDNITPAKELAIQAAWRSANFDLLAFLRSYAISEQFHSADTYKYLSSFDRSLMLFNLITVDNDETFLGLNSSENAEDWLDYQGMNPFNPIHDVFGHQTGLEAANNPVIFKQNFNFEVYRNTLQKTKQLYYLDGTEIDATTWYKDWGTIIPDDGNGNYVVAEVAEWLWNHLIGDGGKHYNIIAQSQLYALLARGDDFGYVAVEEGVYLDRTHAFTSEELTLDPDLSALLATLGAETIDLGSADVAGDREDANARVGQAVQFIAMLPYTFVVEGQ